VCAARVLAGNVERADFLLDDLQQEHGFALLCTTFARSDVTVVTNQEKVRDVYRLDQPGAACQQVSEKRQQAWS
jgi:hypothetical protein